MTRRTRLIAGGLGLLALTGLTACGSDAPSGRTPADDLTPAAASAGASGESGLPTVEAPLFSADSPWNSRVDALPVDPDSASMLRLAQRSVGVVERAGVVRTETVVADDPLYINTSAWTVPVVQGGEPTQVVCRQLVCGDGDQAHPLTLDVPADVDPDPRYDGWFTVLDDDGTTAYDLWRARREDDGTLSYQYLRTWDLSGPGYGEPGQTSARGSGLPLAAGLIRPGELQNGLIDHALAISVPGPAAGSYVEPASSTDGTGSARSLPEGARIRLRADVTIPVPRDPRTGERIRLTAQQQRLADAIVAALRTYGAIVVDRATVPTLYAQAGVTSGLLSGNELQGLHLSDFEVVTLGTRHRAGDPTAATPDAEATR
ncbi:hypothetical protein GCM10022215_28560 [Nocardioides fonticola]|uniref:Lipoprotein n=1 Tax=Nocardioides fonticola TaxID=450363 RepID=A0ABP7XNK8_9ACTN